MTIQDSGAARSGLAAAAALFMVYLVTLAPGLTFWDSGELISAIHTLGIPHPPGTPLYILLGRAWSDVFGFLPRALATNMLSAAATAAACGMLAWLLAVSLRWNFAAFAAALGAGTMSTVWLNATETEVYAASLLLASAMLCSAYRAGLTADARWLVLTAYLFALAAPLHMSALVAAPAAIALASYRGVGATSWKTAVLLTAAMGVAAGVGTASVIVTATALVALICISLVGRDARSLLLLAVLALGLTALAYLPIRAADDPAMNAGNPVTWSALGDLISRRQYGHPGVWPRQAPMWLQLANPLEYADWQVALGMAPGVAPSWSRTPFTVVYLLLGVVGARAHRRRDRRSWLGLMVLLVSATIGLVLYMNFKAGASFGYGILPDSAPHEARDREYFFALAWWSWGAWAGIGAVEMARRVRESLSWVGLAVAALPIALNWQAVNRRQEPAASLPRLYGEALLWSVPEHGVLITGGDNDSFSTWYLQTVEGMRRDVSVVVAPLLGARWYRAQLHRRERLIGRGLVDEAWRGEARILAAVSAEAAHQGRTIVSAVSAGRARRLASGGAVLRGMGWQPEKASDSAQIVWNEQLDAYVDTSAADAFSTRFLTPALTKATTHEFMDYALPQAIRNITCPAVALAATRREAGHAAGSASNAREACL